MRALLPGLLIALAPAPPALAGDENFARVVSAVSLHFDGRSDGDPDRAVLAEEDCAFGLYLYVVDRKRGRDWSAPPALVKHGLDAGPFCGEGTLKAGPNGALLLTVVNSFRPPFSKETLTIVYRGGEFLVAAYALRSASLGGPESLDDPRRSSTCTIDFLARKAIRDGKPPAVARPAPRLAVWDGAQAALCF
jgi:hypothetical protein